MGLCICTQKFSNQVLDDSTEKQEHYSRDIHKLNKKSRFSEKSQVGSQDSKDQQECKTTLSSSENERISSRNECSGKDITKRRSKNKERNSVNLHEVMMAETERVRISKTLKTHDVFSQFNEDILMKIMDKLKLCNLTAKSLLFECLGSSDGFYILSSGKLEVYGDDRTKTVIKPISIIGGNTHSKGNRTEYPIKALEKCTLWRIERNEIFEIIQNTNSINYLETTNFIDFHPVLCSLSPDKKLALTGCFYIKSFPSGPISLKASNLIYFILDGSVTLTLHSNFSSILTRGDFFGEHEISSTQETAELTALTDVTCLVILYSNFINISRNLISQLHTERSLQTEIANSPTFNILTKQQQAALVKVFQLTRYSTNAIVVDKNFVRNGKIMVVLRGKCMWEGSKEVVDTYSCIGSQDIIQETSQIYHDNLVALNVVEIAHLDKTAFENAIGGSYSRITLQNEAYRVLSAITPFHYLHSSKLLMLTKKMRLRTFENKQEILKQGDAYNELYIIHSGQFDLLSYDNIVNTLYKDNCYGKMSLFQDETSKFSLIANDEVSCWVLNKEDFYSVVDSNRRKQLLDRLDYQSTDVNLEDLVIVKPLAKGMSGLVFLTAHKSKNLLYALKTYTRKLIDAYRLYESILNEKSILFQLDHPMILKLVKTFKDEHRIYFLTEYIKGLDLFEVMHKMKRVDESGCRFYTAGLLIILQHVHERNIVFRDLKPENIMIDNDVRYTQGYPKLIDFGTAKVVTDRTYSTVGTPQYMAPEIIQGKGYGIEVDYWSVGIILYELLCGNIPYGDLDDPKKIYDKIIHEEIKYPKHLLASPAIAFIKLMLNINPKLRIQGSIQNLHKHCWFDGFDWDRFMLKEIIAPFKPTIPCLGKEIQDARRSTTKYDKFLSKLEENETFKHRRTRKNPGVSIDWDRDF